MSVNGKLVKNNETIIGINKKLKSISGLIKPTEEIYTKPSGSVAISSNGVYNVSGKATVNVNVPSSGGTSTETEEKTVDLDLSTGNQEINPSADDKLLSKVTIIKPSTLIPSNILKDVVIAGITGTAGEIGGVSKTEVVGVINVGYSEDTKNAVNTYSIPSVYVHNKKESNGDTRLTRIYTPAESFQTYLKRDNLLVETTISVNQSDGYSAVMNLSLYNPSGTLKVSETNLLPENIKSGVSILGVTGSYTGGGSTSTKPETVTLDMDNVTVPYPPTEVHGLKWYIAKLSDGTGYMLYASMFGFGSTGGHYYCVNSDGSGLSSVGMYPYITYKITKKEISNGGNWTYYGCGTTDDNGASGVLKASNHYIYNWSNLSTKEDTINYPKTTD